MNDIRVDARGLACPQPVILTKQAIERHGTCVVLVDNDVARDNVRRFARSRGCTVAVEQGEDGFTLTIESGEAVPDSAPEPVVCEAASGPTVVVLTGDTMGRGDDELGAVLMRSLLHTLGESDEQVGTLICFNAAVKLAVDDSVVLEDLRTLEQKGVRILVCGTCLDWFDLKDQVHVGTVSNMYDIAEAMMGAGRLVQI